MEYHCFLLKYLLLVNVNAELLHMDPNSLEAQVFYQLSKSSNGGAHSPAPSANGKISSFSFEWPFVKFKFLG